MTSMNPIGEVRENEWWDDGSSADTSELLPRPRRPDPGAATESSVTLFNSFDEGESERFSARMDIILEGQL